jgi:hypothetical protein
VTPPIDRELRRVLWKGPAAAASYLIETNENLLPNAWLYVCQDRSYNIEKLSKPARRDVRRSLRHLTIGPASWTVVFDEGWAAFSQTLTRLGLSEISPVNFRRHYKNFSKNPCHRVIGAWKEDCLIAFMTLVIVDDWVEIEGSYFSDEHRGLCPNNGLVHYVLDFFLRRHGFQTVSYGISSVQRDSQNSGLHAYKTKVGFEARPVHRRFAVHPCLQSLVNRITLNGLNAARLFLPGNRRLKKAAGVLAHIVQTTKIHERSSKPVCTWIGVQ